ncbi:MAG: VCBS repeat-containing protein [Bdellovibrionales bacterium]|nr:VCBS repeat-containing protein [Bdellovibrionales bacterium]
MSRITLNSNIQALQANRRIGQSTRSLSESFSRLSSGLRINKASDDAAGLAVADSLQIDSRVYSQAIRNANDGLSLISVAEGAVQNLSNILIRMRELAEQSANGTLDNNQRSALHEEAMALRDEYNRIVESTKFNELGLIDASLTNVGLQVGFGTDGSITFSAGQELSKLVGTGDFEAPDIQDTTSGGGLVAGDFDGDGFVDFIGVAGNSDKIYLKRNKGDGTFAPGELINVTLNSPSAIASADFDGDGDLDLVVGDANDLFVLTNDGSGNFTETQQLALGKGAAQDIVLGDFDGDGNLDILASDSGAAINFYAGNGAAAFSSVDLGLGNGYNIAAGDFNGDGYLDIAAATTPSNILEVMINDGSGNFTSYFHTAVNKLADLSVSDVDGDGLDDIVSSRSGQTKVHFSQGDGTFVDGAQFGAGGLFTSALLQDLNDDGFDDLVFVGGGTNLFVTMLNDGQGNFTSGYTGTATADTSSIAAGDFNNDGALDLILGDSTDGDAILFAIGERSSLLSFFSLQTQDDALEAMSVIDAAMERVSSELGELGSASSRLTSAVRNLALVNENYRTAESQIRDVDVADESANLVRAQILQQAGIAILGQANQLPSLALTLIGSSS